MDKDLRNSLRTVVAGCRQVLEEDVRRQLEGTYGVTPRGEFIAPEDVEPYAVDVREWRRDREEILAAIAHIESYGAERGHAVEQFVRESAFTALNRLAALKLMEHPSRGLIPESVGRFKDSKGFVLFQKISPEVCRAARNGPVLDRGYRLFLESVFDDLSQELGVLFDRALPQSSIFPSDASLKRIVDLLNQADIASVWGDDETIGWAYQYFTPKEVRDRARKRSPAPRNSYELAFRNQFYTPRYVVEFLVDNTLGRLWYDMRGGQTALRERCRYLVIRPDEALASSREAPAKRDPREFRILDPACGSGHFLLYAFDLLETIYLEAWEEAHTPPFGETGKTLRIDHPDLSALRLAIPELIIRHNLFAIDIDLRATQIAALALWLRAQRSYETLGVKMAVRPRITRSNIVCSEPMPGDRSLLEEFASKLQPPLLRQLVHVLFDKMRLAGEAGVLLKIEAELRGAITEAKRQWGSRPKTEQLLLFPASRRTTQQLELFDVSGISDESFWEEAEARVLEILRAYAASAENGKAQRRRLFADDAAQGFAFVDVCRRTFDVILMNPPFGDFTPGFKERARALYPNSYNDIFGAFTECCYGLLRSGGLLGAITSRTGFFLSSFQQWRERFLLKHHNLRVLTDLGEGVMDDAMVEAAAYCLAEGASARSFPVVRTLGLPDREAVLLRAVGAIRRGESDASTFWCVDDGFKALPSHPFVYWVPANVLARLSQLPALEPEVAEVRQGLVTGDNPRFVRALWEVAPARLGTTGAFPSGGAKWAPLVMRGPSQPWYSPITVVLNWEDHGAELHTFVKKYGSPSRLIKSKEFYFRPGFSWTRRAVRFIPYAVPAGCIPTASRYMAFPRPGQEFAALGGAASNIASSFLRFYGEMFARPNFLVETVKALPWPALAPGAVEELENLARLEVRRRRRAYQNHEPFQDFTAPAWCFPNDDDEALAVRLDSFLGADLEARIRQAYGLTEEDALAVLRDLKEGLAARRPGSRNDREDENDEDAESDNDQESAVVDTLETRAESLVSYAVGIAFGRWDVRIGRDPSLAPRLPGPFDPLPRCGPGALVGPDGLPAESGRIVSEAWLRARPDAIHLPAVADVSKEFIPDDLYPARVAWDGILVDDPGHPEDVVRHIEDVMATLLAERAELVEKDVCTQLQAVDLRSYLRNPKGFFEAHVRRYTKSGRKAPIYWLLQSSRKNYGLWLYYHRLTRDTILKALGKFVEPKIRGEGTRLKELTGQVAALAETLPRRERSKLEKEIERQEALLDELGAFKAALERVAALCYEPDLDDGVVLNIAPFHELTPWKEARAYWKELLDGGYEWSTIAKRLRAREVTASSPGRSERHG